MVDAAEVVETVGPQPGPQTKASISPADIVIFGGEAGGGKSWWLCYEGSRHANRKGYSGIIFRRKSTELTGGDSIWEESKELYGSMGAKPRGEPKLDWRFPSDDDEDDDEYNGGVVKFSHMQHEKDVESHKSKAYAYVGFDELTQFEESMFWYMLSRLRTKCGIRPYMRAGTNPDPDSFVRSLIGWWIGEDGYPIPERDGIMRWFIRKEDDDLLWADSPEELHALAPHLPDDKFFPKSLTFIRSRLADNPALTSKDPDYEGNIAALDRVNRERLGKGNWNIRASMGMYFRRHYFPVVEPEEVPKLIKVVRAWDLAASEPTTEYPDPDYSSGVLMGVSRDRNIYILHVESFQLGAGKRDEAISRLASSDGKSTRPIFWQDPGEAGKSMVLYRKRQLIGYTVKFHRASKNKITFAEPVSTYAEGGLIILVEGAWNKAYLRVMERFPEGHDDEVDATSLGFKELTEANFDRIGMMSKW